MLPLPLKLLGRPALPSAPPPVPPPPPSSYAYDLSPAITEWAAIQATNVSANRTQQFHESNIFTQSDAGICFIHTSWHTYAYFRIVIRYNRHFRWYWLGQAADHACSGLDWPQSFCFNLNIFIREATLHGIFFTPSTCRVTLEQKDW